MFVRKQRELLQLECDEERKMLGDKLSSLSSKACESEGLSVLHMEIESIRSGLYGRTVASLQRMDKKPMPAHSLKVGDEVRIYSPKLQYTPAAESSSVNGVITRVSPLHVDFVTDGDVDEPSFPSPLRIDMLANEGTHKKMMSALQDLENMQDSQNWPLADILFGQGATGIVQEIKISPFNAGLNESQVAAIENALGSPYLAAIHGPPGTGKTTAVTELILQAVARRQKVLVCAPSNVAVDNILEKLVALPPSSSSSPSTTATAAPRPQVVRLGHPARVNPTIQQYCLEALITSNEGTEIVNDVRKEMDQLRRAMGKSRDRSHKRELNFEMRALRKEARNREEVVVSSILKSRDVVLATCVGASNKLLRSLDIPFDMVIIDEAAQALEASCWVPMLRSRKCVLAGDHCQLPPTVKCKEAVARGLAVTLFERVVTDTGRLGQTARMLNVQYRMNSIICDWASEHMYHSELHSHSSVAGHTIRGLPSLQRADIPVAMLIDTAGCLMEEDNSETPGPGGSGRSVSHRNPREAEVVARHVEYLLSCGLRTEQIGVITPYNGQLEVLREMLHPGHQGLEIRTVDGFQGGEKEAIVISFVRSNERKEVGFLSDRRRINVAVTRARRHLAIVCDSETCSSDVFIRGLIQHVSEKGEHRSALDSQHGGEMEDDGDTSSAAATGEGKKEGTGGVAGDAGIEASGSMAEKVAAAHKARKSRAEQKRQKHGDADAQRVPTRDNAERAAFDNSLHSIVRQFASGAIVGGRVEFRPPASLEVVLMQQKKSNKLTGGVLRRNLKFPSSLNSYQRQSVHALSEELGLQHESFLEGADRYIQISINMELATRGEVLETGGVVGSLASCGRAVHKEEMGEEEEERVGEKAIDEEDDAEEEGNSEISAAGAPAAASSKSKKSKKKPKKASLPAPPPAGTSSSGAAKQVLGSAALPLAQLPPTHPSFRSRPAHADNANLTSALSQDLDEMALLDAAIRDNDAAKNYNKYRIAATPMPNPEREAARKALRNNILASQVGRNTSSSAAAGEEVKDDRKPKPKAVSKKPFLNMNGTRLGRKDEDDTKEGK